ncbi:MAG: Fe2+-dependent dioxygenase [Gammaproteobacteria bacterium]|nr:Fe2+-dependent dioxygenase [Gammaproteobacteria bacterium]
MLLTIDHLLDAETLDKIQQIFARARFVDGKLTAGDVASRVKNNQQMDPNDAYYQQLNDLVLPNLVKNPHYLAACWPARLKPPYYVRYTSGMTYGEHVDNPLMSEQNTLRTDVSMTIFLSRPEDYDGGELTILDQYGERKIKLDAGSVVIYPSHSRHVVAPVTSGVRQVAVTWAQSRIRDPARREMLYELNQAREILIRELPQSEATRKVSASFNNLVRRWIDI